MFRFFSSQAFNAAPRSAPRQIITMQPLRTSLPTGSMITRWYSAWVGSKKYFFNKHRQEVIKRARIVDIYSLPPDPAAYDVLVSDIKHKTLETTIAKELGIPYLSKATKHQATEVVSSAEGYIYGSGFRLIIPLVAARNNRARWVFFLIDTASQFTSFQPRQELQLKTFPIDTYVVRFVKLYC